MRPADRVAAAPSAPDLPEPEAPPPPRSRRALLTAALGGLAGAVATALGRPTETQAAAGDSLKLGQTNYAGSSATRLNATSSGGAFWMTQYGYGSGVRGDSVNGHGGVFTTAHADRYGLYAQQTGAYGDGAAINADGGTNRGVVGVSTEQAGVSGQSTSDTGVRGVSGNGFGVYAGSASGTAIYAYSTTGTGVYASSGLGYAGYFGSPVRMSSYLDVAEIGVPTNPTVDFARLFVRDNGSGKTELCVIFPTGGVQVLATQA